MAINDHIKHSQSVMQRMIIIKSKIEPAAALKRHVKSASLNQRNRVTANVDGVLGPITNAKSTTVNPKAKTTKMAMRSDG